MVSWQWWAAEPATSDELLYEVPRLGGWKFLETSWTYAYLHFFTVIPVFLLSFDRNVHYYRKWKWLFPAILPVAVVFILWDVFFTRYAVWGFNEDYFLGVRFWGLPIEEWLFFITVPFACVFIYECLNFYVKKDLLAPLEPWLTPALVTLFALVGLLYWGHLYTSTTFLLSAGLLAYHWLFLGGRYRGRFYLAYLVTWIPFLLVNGVLTGGLTEAPVVVYNPAHYLGIRVGSVPLDDSVYNFLMLLGIITLFEHLRPPKI